MLLARQALFNKRARKKKNVILLNENSMQCIFIECETFFFSSKWFSRKTSTHTHWNFRC